MKKLTILSSLLVLTACAGGGSGGGGNGGSIGGGYGGDKPFIPSGPVVSDNNSINLVDSDTGLGMIDINATRKSNVEKANEIASSIETENTTVDFSTPIDTANRAATLARISKANAQIAGHTITDEDVQHAYDVVEDIFIKRENNKNYTQHDVLVAMALIYMDKTKILDLLDNGDGGIDTKINDMIAGLDNDTQIVKDAQNIYADFGKEFKTSLDNAIFYSSSGEGGDKMTFVFDENGQLTGLNYTDDGNTEYLTKGTNGVFISNEAKGYEYSFEFEGPNTGYNEEVEVLFEQENEPTESEIRAKIWEQVQIACDENPGCNINKAAILADIKTVLDAADIHQFDGEEDDEEMENQIVGRYAHYTNSKQIESGNKNLGLKYSDFGLMYSNMILHPDDDMLKYDNITSDYYYTEHDGFFGGYEDNKVDKYTMLSDGETMTFTGDSYAGLTRKQSDAENELNGYKEPENNYYRGTAKLTVGQTNGNLNEKLVADFSKAGWYKVTFENNEFSFDNPQNNNIDDKWKADPENQRGATESATIAYYGPDTNTPTEAVGALMYIENKNSGSDWTLKADIAFGAKRD